MKLHVLKDWQESSICFTVWTLSGSWKVMFILEWESQLYPVDTCSCSWAFLVATLCKRHWFRYQPSGPGWFYTTLNYLMPYFHCWRYLCYAPKASSVIFQHWWGAFYSRQLPPSISVGFLTCIKHSGFVWATDPRTPSMLSGPRV